MFTEPRKWHKIVNGMWCGVVWCSVVQSGVVWCGVVKVRSGDAKAGMHSVSSPYASYDMLNKSLFD